jgi:hypothetical protein
VVDLGAAARPGRTEGVIFVYDGGSLDEHGAAALLR